MLGQQASVFGGSDDEILRVKSAMTTYEQVGGVKTFRRLARVFYARVTRDPLLKRLFSKKTDKQIERFTLFLAETFGGPKRDSRLHCGQRSLKQMHGAFVISEQEIQVWKKHMNAAMDEVGIEGPARRVMRGFFCGRAAADYRQRSLRCLAAGIEATSGPRSLRGQCAAGT